MTNVYTNFLEELRDVAKYAKDIIAKLKYKKIANCKELAKRVNNFQITQIESKIMENIKKLEDFMYNSYKGFYCTICNYENHKFFNTNKQEIIYSEKFCRDMVENTLPTLVFFHVDIVKYINLVSKFLLSCDHKGDYMADVPIPEKLIFVPDQNIVKQLKDCKSERNS